MADAEFGKERATSVASPTPTITGEDIYQVADFEKLCSVHAVLWRPSY